MPLGSRSLQLIIALGLAPFLLQVVGHGSALNEPRHTVIRYCSLDLQGSRLSSEGFAKMSNLSTWPEEPGWDEITVAEGFAISKQVVHENSATVTVVYSTLGTLAGDTFTPKKMRETVQFTLTKHGREWLIASPVIEPHVSPSAARRHIQSLIDGEGPDSATKWGQALKALNDLALTKKEKTGHR
jgi:hypothetical protein